MKDVFVLFDHILESIELIDSYLEKFTKSEFLKNQEKQDAVVKRIEIIGEAVRNVPVMFRNKYPSIPWKKIAGMRDKLIHEYFGIDLDLTWEVVKRDLPELKDEILRIKDDAK